MTEFECGCRTMSECINLNRGDYKKPNWNYLLKTFVNVCGKCGKKQMKFQICGKQTFGNGKTTNGNVYEL